jgi:hypothetical protein
MDEPTSKLSPARDLFLIGKRGVDKLSPQQGRSPKMLKLSYLRVAAGPSPLEGNAFWGIRLD